MTLMYFKQGTNQVQVNTEQVPDVGHYVEVYTSQYSYNLSKISRKSCDYVMAGTVKEISYIYERYYDETIVYITVELNEGSLS